MGLVHLVVCFTFVQHLFYVCAISVLRLCNIYFTFVLTFEILNTKVKQRSSNVTQHCTNEVLARRSCFQSHIIEVFLRSSSWAEYKRSTSVLLCCFLLKLLCFTNVLRCFTFVLSFYRDNSNVKQSLHKLCTNVKQMLHKRKTNDQMN